LSLRAAASIERVKALRIQATRIGKDYQPRSRTAARENAEQQQVIASFTEAIDIDPSNAIAYFNRGRSHTEKGEFDRAIADWTEAIRLNADSAEAYYKLRHHILRER
jgi:tetratricopeptide (TPR) repeat protein